VKALLHHQCADVTATYARQDMFDEKREAYGYPGGGVAVDAGAHGVSAVANRYRAPYRPDYA
jgi:hypothetical protein